MPLKSKTPPPLPESTETTSRNVTEERMLRVNPEVDRRLDQFIQNNQTMNQYYTTLVNDSPDRAVRAFMLNKMFKYEAELRVAARQAPQAKEWLNQQPAEVQLRVAERLEKVSPSYRQQASVRIIAQEKTKVDFTPKISSSQGLSI